MTSDIDRGMMLRLARGAVISHVTGAPRPVPPSTPLLDGPGAAFVTLHSAGQLRGCIGHVEATEPLGHVIVRCAVAACSTDPRFPPVTAAELAEISLELSILGPLEPIEGSHEIEIGRHGLIIELGPRRGLLLPQVATEWGWDRDAFVMHTCRKAGLSRDAWKQGARMWRFEAEIFGDGMMRPAPCPAPGTSHGM